jgi:hypothetical protein
MKAYELSWTLAKAWLKTSSNLAYAEGYAPAKVGMIEYMYIKHSENFPSVFRGYIHKCPSKKDEGDYA